MHNTERPDELVSVNEEYTDDTYREESKTAALCKIFFNYMFPCALREHMAQEHTWNHLMETTCLYMNDVLWSSDNFATKVKKLCALSAQWKDDCTEEHICLRSLMTPQNTHTIEPHERFM